MAAGVAYLSAGGSRGCETPNRRQDTECHRNPSAGKVRLPTVEEKRRAADRPPQMNHNVYGLPDERDKPDRSIDSQDSITMVAVSASQLGRR
ncbi:hypothetical protein Adi01nite_40880 [Amorphoplanes digitatis]|nr:hypothetical protein Adi01nite_40880 [Actinoplanes digitatis]